MTGTVGASEVAACFERLSWGVAENSRHDLGTDLFLMARNARGFDLGLMVGAQVKAGESQFDEPVTDANGTVTGWWFRSDRSHSEYWLGHVLPHIVVLYDLDRRIAFWEHMTPQTVVSTGAGVKVLVPSHKTVDVSNLPQLIDVAASKLEEIPLEGTAWGTTFQVPDSDLLRYALLVPRLISPHANAGVASPVSPAQAVALLAQARISDLTNYLHQQNQGEIENLDSSDIEEWRFAAEFYREVMGKSAHQDASSLARYSNSATKVAAHVVAAASLIAKGEPDRAISLLEAGLATDDASPVDHAWCQLQLARAYTEIGRISDAKQLAIDLQSVRQTHTRDVTASSIAGSGALLLFMLADWQEGDLAAAVAAMDTAAEWWRTQTLADGLVALTNRSFREWARDTAVTFGKETEVNNTLFAASIQASLAGDQSRWRFLASTHAKSTLLAQTRHTQASDFEGPLWDLVQAGDTNGVKLAARRIREDGPAIALSSVVQGFSATELTHTSASPAIELLIQAGSFADQSVAARILSELLTTLTSPERFNERTHPGFRLHHRATEAVAGIAPALTASDTRTLVEFFASLQAQTDQSLAMNWQRALQAIPSQHWTEDLVASLGQEPEHYQDLTFEILRIQGQFLPEARDKLLTAARSLGCRVLPFLGEVDTIAPSLVATILDDAEGHVRQQLEDARRSTFGAPFLDYGDILALLNLFHPADARWDTLLELLETDTAAATHKMGAYGRLSAWASKIPLSVRERLLAVARRTSQSPDHSFKSPIFGGDQDVPAAALQLLHALGEAPTEVMAALPSLIAHGDPHQRRRAVTLAARAISHETAGILVALSGDPDPRVRATCAAGLAQLLSSEWNSNLVAKTLLLLSHDSGELAPLILARALGTARQDSSEFEEVLANLRVNPSARVRNRAALLPVAGARP